MDRVAHTTGFEIWTAMDMASRVAKFHDGGRLVWSYEYGPGPLNIIFMGVLAVEILSLCGVGTSCLRAQNYHHLQKHQAWGNKDEKSLHRDSCEFLSIAHNLE